MLAFSHTYIQAQAPAINEVYYYNGGGFTPISPTNIPTHTPIYLHFDRDVVKPVSGLPFGAGEILTTAFLTLTQAGSAVPFTASINGRWITMIPTSELVSSSAHLITLNPTVFLNTVTPIASATSNASDTFTFTTATLITPSIPTLILCSNNVPQTLGSITIAEGSSASFGEGINQTFEMNAPAGFNFIGGSGGVLVTGSDVSNASLFVTATKITLLYSVSTNYFTSDVITLQNIQVVFAGATASANLVRTGGNATQAGNRQSQGKPHGNFDFAAIVTAPTLPAAFTSSNLSICSGFAITDATSFTIAAGTSAYFYDASNTLIHTTTTAGVSRQNLGYTGANNTILGAKQFYVTTRNNTTPFCESAKVSFTITINPAPVVNITPSTVTSAICTPDQITFTAVGTSGAVYTFLWNGSPATATANGTLSTTNTANDTYTTNATVSIASVALSVIATVAGCSTTSNTVPFTVLGAKPTVAFVWTATTNYTTADSPVDLQDPAAIPTFGGRVNGAYNTVGGVYSGVSVAGTKFYPAAAPIGTHRITYTYTNAVGCTSSAFVDFNVSDGSNAIVGINTSYCQSDPISGALTPKPAFVIPTATGITPVNLFSAYPICGTCLPNQFMFPIFPGCNQGIVFSGGIYTFNPDDPSIVYPGASNSVNITIIMLTFKNTPNALIFVKNITVYKKLVLTTNLDISNKDFCPSTPPLTITPLVFGVSPTSGTTTLEYYLTSTPASIFPLPMNTITPSSFTAGNYTLKYTYTSTQGCSKVLTVPFAIKSNATPIMAIKSSSGAFPIITSACTSENNIRLEVSAGLIGDYTINKLSPVVATATFGTTGGTTIFPISSLGGAGVYTITFTTPGTATTCAGTSVVNNLTIYDNPIPNFVFDSGNSICGSATTFSLTPSVTPSVLGSGFFNIKKQGTAGSGANFIIADNSFDYPTDFNATNSGIGAGIYDITYTYTTTSGLCKGTVTKQFTINPTPTLSFTLSVLNNEICNKPIRDNVTLILNWSNAVAPNILDITRGKIKIYAAMTGGAVLHQFLATNTILSNNITIANPNIVNDFYVEYEYLDNNNCTGFSPRIKLTINPLPAITFNFTNPLLNEFCHGDGNSANFTVSVTGVNVPPFDASKGRIYLRNNPLSIPTTTANTPILPVGVTSFNPSSIIGIGNVGEYFVDYTYEDTKGCFNTVTAPISLKVKFYTRPQFLFPVTATFPTNSPSFAICEDVTSFTLTPSLLNMTAYGTDNPLVSSRGFYTITKGAFTALVTGVDTFNPNALLVNAVGGGPGTYDIKYTYTSALGCVGETTARQLIINPLPLVSFTFTPVPVIAPAVSTNIDVSGNGFFCADFTTIGLTPSVFGAGASFSIQEIGVLPLLSPIIITSYIITRADLSMLVATTTVKTYQIVFRYIDANTCLGVSAMRTFTIIPVPIPLFTVALQKCVNIPVLFNATTSTIQPPLVDAVASYAWNFDDNSAVFTTTSQTTSHTFTAFGSYNVSLTITSVLGCTKTIITPVIIGAIPVAGFTTANFCQGDATAFSSTSTLLGSGNITTYTWSFGEPATTPPTPPTTTTTPNATHTYSVPGRYTARLTVTTNSLCTDFIERDVLIFPRITPTAAVPYKENFDINNGFWLANGLIKSTVNPTQDIVGYSWAGGVPTGAKINASTTAGGAWSTKTNANTFYPSERSYVESPCFNFTDPTLNKPMISMKVWYDTDRGSDGAVLFASINDGVSWNVVGTINEGIEWYNTAGIIAQPGGQSVVNAWTGNTLTAFKIAKFNLDKFRGQASVRFRVAFGSNADNPTSQVFDGFAFDEVFIGNRNRISLLEHFTNASSSEANTENTFINNFPPAATQNEVYNIQYHTNFPGNDPMNNDNTADPSARALFYSVSQVPRTAIDGVIENRKFSEWGTPIYNKRTLEASPFEISVNFPNIPRELLNVTATVKALEPFARRVIVQTVVVEQEILGTVFTTGNFGGLTFKNVVKKMIPNAAGTIINKTWLAGTQEVLNLNWSPSKVYNGNKLVLVVFVQDETTKEIYQAAYFNVTTNPTGTDPTTALDNTMQLQTLENEFVVYPNPAQNEVFTGFRQETAEDFSVILFDSYGKRVDVFSLTKGNKGLLINTEKYASGMYFVEITGKNNIKVRRKLVIAR